MSREPRQIKENDQETIAKAERLIFDLMYEHPEIEPAIWLSALTNAWVHTYQFNDFSYDEFCEELLGIAKHYKSSWD